jgi:hypothetical protein
MAKLAQQWDVSTYPRQDLNSKDDKSKHCHGFRTSLLVLMSFRRQISDSCKVKHSLIS